MTLSLACRIETCQLAFVDVPDGIAALLVGSGLLLVLTALIGGGFEVKDVKIPPIPTASRAMCFATGALFIVLGLPTPALDPDETKPDEVHASSKKDDVAVEEHDAEPAPLVVVPAFEGRSLDDARAALEAAGLQVGNVHRQTAWVPDGEVLALIPPAGSSVEAGSSVDVAVADAEFTFRAQREWGGGDDGPSSVSTEYRVTLLRAQDTGELVGRFELAEVTTSEAAFEEDPSSEPETGAIELDISIDGTLLDDLVGSDVFIPLGGLDSLDLELAWEALGRIARDLRLRNTDAIDTTGAMAPSMVGDAILAAMIIHQATFDIRTVFTSLDAVAEAQDGVELQAAGSMLSSIRVEGVGTSTGNARRFPVVRREQVDAEDTRVGTATYSTDTGLLELFDVEYLRGDGRYSLVIRRL